MCRAPARPMIAQQCYPSRTCYPSRRDGFAAGFCMPMAPYAGMRHTRPPRRPIQVRPREGGYFMITFVRTATIAPGKLVEAMGFAHQVGQHVEKITGLKVVVATPVGGNPFRIAWVTAQ